jgi:hypothetical protein
MLSATYRVMPTPNSTTRGTIAVGTYQKTLATFNFVANFAKSGNSGHVEVQTLDFPKWLVPYPIPLAAATDCPIVEHLLISPRCRWVVIHRFRLQLLHGSDLSALPTLTIPSDYIKPVLQVKG